MEMAPSDLHLQDPLKNHAIALNQLLWVYAYEYVNMFMFNGSTKTLSRNQSVCVCASMWLRATESDISG